VCAQVLLQVGVKRIGHWCLKDWQPPVLGPIYEVYMLLVILVFPLVAMTFAYVSICLELWTVGRQVTSFRYSRARNQGCSGKF